MEYKTKKVRKNNTTEYRTRSVREGKTYSNRGGLGEGLGYVAGNVGIGAAGIAEGITDLVSAAGYAITGQTDKAKAQFLDSWSGEWKRQLDEWYNPSATMSFIGDVGAGVGNSLMAAIPFVGLPAFYAGAVGGGISSAAEKTGDVVLKEIGYGLTSGIIEGTLEKYVGPTSAKVKGLSTKALSSLTKKTTKSAVRNSIWKQVLSNASEEFLEEALSEMIDPLMQRFYHIDPNATTSFGEVLKAGAVGAISGGILGGAQIGLGAAHDSSVGRNIAANGNSATVKHTAEAVLSSPFFADQNGIKDEGISDLAATLNTYNALTPEKLASGEGYRLLGAMKRQIFSIEARTKSAPYRRELVDKADKTAEYATKFYGKNYTAADIKADKDGILTHLTVLKWAGDAEIQARAKANVEAARTEAMAKGDLTNDVIYRAVAEMEAQEKSAVTAEATKNAEVSPTPASTPSVGDTTIENPAIPQPSANSQAIENLGQATAETSVSTAVNATGGATGSENAVPSAVNGSTAVTEPMVAQNAENNASEADKVQGGMIDRVSAYRMTTEQLNERYDRIQERKNELVREYATENDEGRRKEINREIKKLKGDMVTINTALRRRGSERYNLEDRERDASAENNEYEADELLYDQLQDWLDGGGKAYGTYNGEYFKLGETPVSLTKWGARKTELIMSNECVAKIAGGKHSISLEELSYLPSELKDPVLLFKGSVPNSFVALTEMLDKQGNDVVVAIHINKLQKRNIINRVASVYSKSGKYGNNNIENYVQAQIEAGNLVDASKEKAPIWFTNRGLQLPKLVQTIIGAGNSIHQNGRKVNGFSEKNSERENLTEEEAIAEERAAAEKADAEAEENAENAKKNDESAGKTVQDDSDLIKPDARTKRMLGSYEASVVEKARKLLPDFDLLSFERKVAVCELIDTSPNMGRNELKAMCVLVASRDGLFAYSSPTKHRGIHKVLAGMKDRRLIVLSNNENVISGEGKGNVVGETIFHEIVHDIKALDEKVFDRLAATAFKYISKEQKAEIQDRYTEHYTGKRYSEWASDEKLTDKSIAAFLKANPVKENFKLADTRVAEIIAEEVVAGYVGKAFADTRYVKYLGDTDPKLFKRVARTFNTLFRCLFGKNRFAERALIDVYAHFTNALAETQVKDIWSKSTVIYQRYDEDEDGVIAQFEKAMKEAEGEDVERLSLEDSEYLSAVERGDMETAQRMVDEAAKAAGYAVKAYHGTNAQFTVFDTGKQGQGIDQFGAGFYFANNSDVSERYGTRKIEAYLKLEKPIRILRKGERGNLYDVRITKAQAHQVLKRHPLIYDAENSPLGDFYEEYWEVGAKEWMVKDLASRYSSLGDLDGDLFRKYPNELHEALRDVCGYDGVWIHFETDAMADERNDEYYVTWFPEQAKSADPVTYDDDGKVIPLSKRFSSEEDDIRYSLEGETADGRLCYKSDFDSNMPMEERVKLFKERIATIFNLGAVELRTNSRKLVVRGDRFTWNKNLYGDSYPDPKEYEAKINSLYDLADILATSKYDPDATVKEESYDDPNVKPKNAAHKGVKYWHKFRNEIVLDGEPYTVIFNIRDKGNEQYQYLIEFKENKTQGLSNTAVKSLLRTDRASYGNSIHPNGQKVNSSAQNNSGNSSTDEIEHLSVDYVTIESAKRQVQEKATLDQLYSELRDRGVSATAANKAADEIIRKHYRQVVSSQPNRVAIKRAIMRSFVLWASAENSAVRFKRAGDGELQAREQHSKRAFKIFDAHNDLLSRQLPQYEVNESMWETVRAAQAEIEMLWNGENDSETVQTYKELRQLYPTVFTVSAEELDADSATEIIRKVRGLKHDDLATPLSEEQVKAAREAFISDLKEYSVGLSSAMGTAAKELKEERRIHGYKESLMGTVRDLRKMLKNKRIGAQEADALVMKLIDRITKTNSEASGIGDRGYVEVRDEAIIKNLSEIEQIINGLIHDLDEAGVLRETELSQEGERTVFEQYVPKDLMDEIRICATRVAAKKGERITADEYELIARMMLGIKQWYKEYDMVFFEGKMQNRKEVIDKWLSDSYGIVQIKSKKNGIKGMVKDFMKSAAIGLLDTHAVWASFDGYRANGLFTRLWDQLEGAMAKQAILKEQILAERDAFLRKHKGFELELKTKKVKYQGHEITLGEAITILMTAKREQAFLALYGSDLTVMSDPAHHFKGKGFEGASEEHMRDDIRLRIAELKNAIGEDSAVKAYVEIVERFFNETSKNIKKNADNDYFGYTNVEEGYYIPITRDKSAFSPDMLSAGGQMDQFISLTSLPFNKHTIKNAKAALVIGNINDLVNRHADGLSKYATMYQPVNAVNRILGRQITVTPQLKNGNKIWIMEKGDTGSPNSIMKILADSIWDGEADKAKKYFRDLLNASQGFSQKQYNAAQKLVDYITRNATFNVLGLNIKSVMSQLAGIPLAGYAVSPPNLLKGLASMSRKVRDLKAEAELMDKYSEQAHSRNIDGSAVHVGALAEKMGHSAIQAANTLNKISEATMVPISATDRFTFLVVWSAAQYQAEAQGYAIGTEENRKMAGKIVDEFAKMTQPTTSAANSAAARTDNIFAKALMRFTAATNKMFSRLCEGGARYLTLKEAKKEGLGGVTDKEIKDAKSQFKRMGGAIVVSNIMLVGLIQLFKFAFAKDRDEETLMGDIASDALDSFIGMVPVISQINGLISDGYEISDMSFDAINDTFKALQDTGKIATSIATGEVVESTEIARVLRNSVYNLGAMMGIPVRNTWNNVTGLIKRVSPSAGANINAIFYDPTATELARALGSENEQLAETVANLMLARRGGKVDYGAAQEFLSLYSTPNDEGELDVYNVMPRQAKEEISVDGKKYILNAKQYKSFKQVYGGVVTAVSELVTREDYKSLPEEGRAKAIKSLYSLYYSRATTAALGTDPVKSEVISEFVSDTTGYLSALAYASGISGDGRKDKILDYLKKSGLSASDQTWVLASLGYKAEKEKAIEQVKRSKLTEAEKANVYKRLTAEQN